MNTWNERLQQAIEDSGLKKSAFAKKVGVSPPTVTDWISGEIKTISAPNAERVAAALSLNTKWLVSGKGPKHVDQLIGNTGAGPPIHSKYPLISSVQAGRWTDIVDNFSPGDAEDWIASTARLSKFAFALRVEGDSMVGPPGTKSVPEGSIIIVDPQLEPHNGSFVVAKLPGEDKAVFKKFVKDGPRLYLMPLNPTYRPIEIDDSCIIVGVVKRAEIDL